jgi:hypothetical protein
MDKSAPVDIADKILEVRRDYVVTENIIVGRPLFDRKRDFMSPWRDILNPDKFSRRARLIGTEHLPPIAND